MYQLLHYINSQGEDLFGRWLDGLKDRQAQSRIAARLIRLNNGNFGDCKPVGGGVWELRVDWGPGSAFTTPSKANVSSCCVMVATNGPRRQTLIVQLNVGTNGS